MQTENKKPWIVSFVERHKPLVALLAFNLIAVPFQFMSPAVGLFVTVINCLFLAWCFVSIIVLHEIGEYHEMSFGLWTEQSKLNKSMADILGGFDERLKALENKNV